jgi:hypothetical protein
LIGAVDGMSAMPRSRSNSHRNDAMPKVDIDGADVKVDEPRL